MDAATRVGGESTRELREQIGMTHQSLNRKIDQLGGEVRHVVGEIAHTVTDKVSAARHALTPADWVRSRPLLICLGAVCVGALLARRREAPVSSGEARAARPVKSEVAKVAFPLLASFAQSVGRHVVEGYLARSQMPPESRHDQDSGL